MNIQTDRALVPANVETTRYLTITVTAPDRERRRDRPSVNAAFVIDRSGSMAGRKLTMATKAVDHAIRLLDERDRLALVCYDHEVQTLLSNAPASAEAKALAIDRLKALDGRGNTNLQGGWLRGADEVANGQVAGGGSAAPGLSRVLLLSDGLANEGETNPDALARKAAELRAKGIATSAFGVGADFDERLMSRLATEGGGHFYFIEQAEQIPDFLASELGDALEVVARDARIVLNSDSAVATVLGGFPTEIQGDDFHVRLGDLVAGQVVTVVLAVRLQARPIGAEPGGFVRLTDRDGAFFPQPMRVDWRAVDAAEDAAQPVNVDVLVAVAKQLAEQARRAALEANRHGLYDKAAQVIAQAVAAIRGLAPGVHAVDAVAAELKEREEIFSAKMSARALKEQHFENYAASLSRDSQGRTKKVR